jgi:hypothetical protein
MVWGVFFISFPIIIIIIITFLLHMMYRKMHM